jgi:alpha-mannosidase
VRQFAAAAPPASGALDGIWLDGDGLVFSACQPTEDGRGLFLRCYNARETAASGAWRFGQTPSSASVVRADGTVIETISPASLLPAIPIVVEPRAVHTLRLTFEK